MTTLDELAKRADEYFSQGKAHKEEGKYEDALAFFQKSMEIDREIRPASVGADLVYIGDCYKSIYDYKHAEEAYREGLPLIEREVGPDHPVLGSWLISLAGLYETTGRYSEAEPLCKRALVITEKALGSDHPGVATMLNYLAVIFETTSRYSEAEPMYTRALAITEKALDSEHPDVAIWLNNLAGLYETMGRYSEAEPMYTRALAISEKVYGPDHPDVAIWLNNLAGLYQTTGRYAEAEPLYRRALAITEKVYGPDHPDVAKLLNNLAELYKTTGRYAEAEPLYTRALAITEETHGPDYPVAANMLNNLAILYQTTNRYAEAELLYSRALAITEETHGREHRDVATWLNNLAVLYNATGRDAEAEPLYTRALGIIENIHGLDHPDMATKLNNLANMYRTTGRYAEAEPLCLRALQIAHSSRIPKPLGDTQHGFSILFSRLNNLDAAIFFGKQAVTTTQGIRENVSKMGKKILRSYDITVENIFKHLSELLIDSGRFLEAEQVLNLLKQNEYFEYIRRDATQVEAFSNKVTFTSLEEPFNLLYLDKAAGLASVVTERNDLLGKKDRTAAEEDQLIILEEKLEEARSEFQAAIERIRDELGGTAKAMRVEQLEEAKGLMQDLRELGDGTVALYTVAGEKIFHLLLITPEYRKAYSYDIGEKELKRKIFSFRQALMPDGKRLYDPRDLARELYNIILAPVAKELRAVKAKTLLWSLEGALRYLPVTTLHDGKRYLVETYRNVMFTPASQPRLKDSPRTGWKGFGLGVTKSHEHFPPLPLVKEELLGIIRSRKSSKGIMEGQVYLDRDFTYKAMKKGLYERYPLVHIASHFHMVPGNDTMSFLLLGDGQRLTLDKFRNQSLLFGDVELLTLSACNTAMGNLGQDGKEVECFGVLAQQQGAKAIVATLWPVADISTSLLMREFYRQRISGKSKAEALRQAQLGLLTGRLKAKKVTLSERGGTSTSAHTRYRYEHDPKAPFAHPYFWAPFILIGNWK